MSNNRTKSSGSYNYGYYSNPEIDEIGLEVASTMDPKLRLALMQQGFMIAMDDVAWIPLYTPLALYGCNRIFDWNPGNCADYCVEKIVFK
jgi:ABC-type transport system substrate-binding protein